MNRSVLIGVEYVLAFVTAFLFGSLIAFIYTYGRLPVGHGEMLNWLLGLPR